MCVVLLNTYNGDGIFPESHLPPVPLKSHPAFPVHYYPSQTTSCSNMDAQPGTAAARMTWSQGGLRNRCTPFLGDGKRCEVHLVSLQRLGNTPL